VLLITYNPLTLLLIKKKSYSVDPARAISKSIDFVLLHLYPCLPLPRHLHTSFYSPPTRIEVTPHFIPNNVPICSYLSVLLRFAHHLPQATSLACPLFFYSPSGSDNSAAPQTIKKTRWRDPQGGPLGFLVVVLLGCSVLLRILFAFVTLAHCCYSLVSLLVSPS
jgi:hypothetical protein